MKIVKPTLVLNKTVCMRNIELMQEKAKRHNLQFRPHFKTHQSLEIGGWFKELGIHQITVSSVTMAKYFANDGWDDISIAVPFNIHEIDQLNQLAKHVKINILVDSLELITMLNQKLTDEVGVFIKITTGYQRAGISSSSITYIEKVLQEIKQATNLNFKGFLSHSGHTYNARSRNEVQNIHFDTLVKMGRLKNHFIKDFPDIQISIGDTPACSISENFQNVDEIRPGNFVFYDLIQHKLGACNIDDIAVRMHCPVISKQQIRNEIVIYGGAVHFSKDWMQNIDGKPTYGRIILNRNGEKQLLGQSSYLCRLSQEHGILRVTHKEFQQIQIGDFVEIIPIHSCLTANAMGKLITTKGEEIDTLRCL